MTTTMTERQLEVAKLFKEALAGNAEAKHKLSEGIATSDIPVQLSPTLSYVALKAFEAIPQVWPQFADKESIADFESHPYYTFVWGDGDIEAATAGEDFVSGGLARIPEYGEYPVLRFSASEISISTAKSGVQIKFSWESLHKTRNFNLLKRTFAEFGKRAAIAEDVEATKVLVNKSGINTANFKVANQNVLTGNPELSLEALKAAFEQIATQTDILGKTGQTISVPAKWNLVIGQGLQTVADEILAVQSVETVVTDGDTETRTKTGNPVAGRINKVIVNPYINKIAGANADKAWFLLPTVGSMPRPAVVNVFLEGYEKPSVFIQKTTTSNPEDGNFIDDSYATKTRHVVAGAFIDPAGTIVSSGAGS